MKKTLNSLSILGAGRVGQALGRLLRGLGWRIDTVVTRSPASARRAARFVGEGKPHVGMTRQILTSRVILIAVPDDAIAGVAQELARTGAEELLGKIVLHTSGALDAGVLGIVKAQGAVVGSLHPLQSFSGVTVPSLQGKVFAVEGDVLAVRMARRIARSLGGSPVRIPGGKALYHAAATMAAGQVLAVEEAAGQLLISLGMTRREALHALLPLTRQVLENYERFGPRAAWTGPLSRLDYNVVRAHLKALRDAPPEFASSYRALNRLAARVLAQDAVVMLAELQKMSVEEKPKVKAKGHSA
jgi:predicted short-subunit dehydrogenase-like oxidoreductase (DUF2520 family)